MKSSEEYKKNTQEGRWEKNLKSWEEATHKNMFEWEGKEPYMAQENPLLT